MRVALSVDLGCWVVDPEIESLVRSAASTLRDLGIVVDEISIGLTPRVEKVHEELMAVFMAAYYGHLVDEFGDRMDPDVIRLIDLGGRLSAVQLKQLELERTDLWHKIAKVLASYDAIVCPTTAQGPPLAAKAERSTVEWVADGRSHSPDMTCIVNLVAPCPALSVPCGWDRDGMPVGLQIIGQRWREDMVLTIGRAFESARPDLRRRPNL
jgi:Asp-tRNA(Asn)/Glu-tRNA(Gln) amidotransferase A subunit family amidase